MNRKGEAKVIHAFDIYEEYEGEVDADEILHELMPEEVRKFNSKFFALVMPATHHDSEGNETDVLILMTSSVGELNCQTAEIDREDEYLELDAWVNKDPEAFADIAEEFRHAITLQG